MTVPSSKRTRPLKPPATSTARRPAPPPRAREAHQPAARRAETLGDVGRGRTWRANVGAAAICQTAVVVAREELRDARAEHPLHPLGQLVHRAAVTRGVVVDLRVRGRLVEAAPRVHDAVGRERVAGERAARDFVDGVLEQRRDHHRLLLRRRIDAARLALARAAPRVHGAGVVERNAVRLARCYLPDVGAERGVGDAGRKERRLALAVAELAGLAGAPGP